MKLSANKKFRVLVAMSGGVDSSVAAALLVRQGYEVTGAFMKNFSEESWKGVLKDNCPWEDDLKDVIRVCQKLKIPYRSFNFEKEYRKKVIDYLFAEYRAGRTPNPDIMCNKEIKFKLFLQQAERLGFDYIATGHYARLRRKFPISNFQFSNKPQTPIFKLLKGADREKDQSYFLYTLNQRQLAKTLFPVGCYQKSQIRALARKLGLSNANKPDSQGICFVGHINLREFLKQRIPEKKGEIRDTQGRVLGYHHGAWYYTIGQRHGLGLGGGVPYYVVRKNVRLNTLTVAPGRYHRLVYDISTKIINVHWINPNFAHAARKKLSGKGLKCAAKIRYQQKDQTCRLKKNEEGLAVKFQKPQFAIAPGQSIVFYKGHEVLGGGIITQAEINLIHAAA